MLWNIIRDWFVQYIFGGTLSNQSQINNAFFGVVRTSGNNFGNTTNVFLPLEGILGSSGENIIGIALGDWLSTTATIITLVLLVIMLLALVRFIIRQVCGLFAKI